MLAFLFVLTDLVEIFNKQPCQQLLRQIVHLLLGHFAHNFFAACRLIDDGHKILGKTQREVIHWALKNVNQNVRKCINQIVCRVFDSFGILTDRLNDFVDDDEAFDAFS